MIHGSQVGQVSGSDMDAYVYADSIKMEGCIGPGSVEAHNNFFAQEVVCSIRFVGNFPSYKLRAADYGENSSWERIRDICLTAPTNVRSCEYRALLIACDEVQLDVMHWMGALEYVSC